MSNKKPRGYLEHILAIDVETTGLFFNNTDPSFDEESGKYHQVVSIGLVVADATTFEEIEDLYIEIKWDGESEWNVEAENIHGLSKQYLEENGFTNEEAVLVIGQLLLKYWGGNKPVALLGHNVATFDKFFFQRLMMSQGIHVKHANRHIDSFSVGKATVGSCNSDDLFEAVGIPTRDSNSHNALDDAKASLTSVRTVKQLWDAFVAPQM